MAKKANNNDSQPLEITLFKAADKLRKNMDAAEYKHIVLGLIFLKYISDAFEEMYQKLAEGKGHYAGANPEDIDEYKAENVFFVPQQARWNFLLSQAKQPTIGKTVDDAMDAIEAQNPILKGVLPKQYARPNLDKNSLGGLIDLLSTLSLGHEAARSKDLLGKVYEYFLGQFALAEGKKGGQFYTPTSVVKLLVEMLEPYSGRVFDPCCGSGGMFVHSEKFIEAHQGKIDDISIYGQESNQTTWRLAKMNLAIRGINAEQVKWNNEGSFLKDAHPDLKADYVIANPPFNDSDWSGDLLTTDGRWKYGVPPAGNANYAWIQHFLYHLSPTGTAGFVLSKGALSTRTSNEGEIRKNLVDAQIVDCIVNLPTKLFLNTQIPACLWFLSRSKANGFPSPSGRGKGEGFRKRENEILFIDARNMGQLINRRTRELTDDDINQIAQTYHNWRNKDNSYQDVPGFCKSATIQDVANLNYVLTPGRYIGLPDDEEDFNFIERYNSLKTELAAQMNEEEELNKAIINNLSKLDTKP
jgi:type I restriction enzyme M protein